MPGECEGRKLIYGAGAISCSRNLQTDLGGPQGPWGREGDSCPNLLAWGWPSGGSVNISVMEQQLLCVSPKEPRGPGRLEGGMVQERSSSPSKYASDGPPRSTRLLKSNTAEPHMDSAPGQCELQFPNMLHSLD